MKVFDYLNLSDFVDYVGWVLVESCLTKLRHKCRLALWNCCKNITNCHWKAKNDTQKI